MIVFVLRRILLGILVLVTVSALVFLAGQAVADPAVGAAGDAATAKDIEARRVSLGLDQPQLVQYLNWATGTLSGSLGTSYRFDKPVAALMMDRLPITLSLGTLAMAISVSLATILLFISARRPEGAMDNFVVSVASIAQSVPTFWLGLLLILGFSVNLNWLPSSGSGSWQYFVLPSIALGIYGTPEMYRVGRASVLDQTHALYVRAARARGNTHGQTFRRHVLPNSLLPVIPLVAVQFGAFLGGSIVVETLFSLRGTGFLAWEAVMTSDLPVLQGVVLLVATFYTAFNILADLLSKFLDPRETP